MPATRIVLAHDYLTQRGGAEKVVLALSRGFPDSPVRTTLYEPASTYPEFERVPVRPGAINRVALFRAITDSRCRSSPSRLAGARSTPTS